MEKYEWHDGYIVRSVQLRDGTVQESRALAGTEQDFDKNSQTVLAQTFDKIWLETKVRPVAEKPRGELRIADLFAGCGGLSLGLEEAARALNLLPKFKLAVDLHEDALAVYGANFREATLIADRVEKYIDGVLGTPLTKTEKELLSKVGGIDLVIGGPPCQGHSALNNHTRHQDSRNELYLIMARFCEVFRPRHVVIENVPGVLKDKSQVAQRTWAALEELGYKVQSLIVNCLDLGVAQSRKRSVTVASLDVDQDFRETVIALKKPPRDLTWAIGDLLSLTVPTSIFDSASIPSSLNLARIDYLFENNLFDLPDSERPDCHRLKEHSYGSVYGRLAWSKPSQTITTGFGGMGRGRYVHPEERRTLTPHEAARIQFFPDFFIFPTSKRTTLQMIIGNAVPPKLGYAIGMHLLR